ncbi:MAG: hypothetical protein ACI901_001605 [Octadecabacter sp.]|jgi:hypothetical protein
MPLPEVSSVEGLDFGFVGIQMDIGKVVDLAHGLGQNNCAKKALISCPTILRLALRRLTA